MLSSLFSSLKKSEAILMILICFSYGNMRAQCTGSITYSPSPVVSFCSGKTLTIQNTSGGAGYSVQWRFNGSIIGTGNTLQYKFTSTGNFYLVRVFNNCRDSVKIPLAVDPKPKASLTSSNFFRNCTGDPSININPFTLSIANASSFTNSTPVSFSVDWGDGSPVENLGSSFNNTTHAYDGVLGLRTLTFIATGSNGCSDTLEQTVFNGRPPKVALPSGGANLELCIAGSSSGDLLLNLENFQNNPPGTIYIVESNDPKTKADTFYHPPPNPIVYRFKSSSCGFTSALTPNSFGVTITAKNFCPLPQSNTRAPIIVKQKPEVTIDITPSNIQCINTPVTFKAFNTGQDIILNPATGLPDCTKDLITSNWSITPSTYTVTSGSLNSGSFTATFNTPGNYQVRFKGSNSCETDSFFKNFCVRKPPDASFTFTTNTECAPVLVKTTNTSASLLGAACQPSTWEWQVFQNSAVCTQKPTFFSFKTGGSASESPQIELNGPGTYTIKLTERNGCGEDSEQKDFKVKGKPEIKIAPISGDCGGAEIEPRLDINKSCLGTVSQIYWTFKGALPETGFGAAPGKIAYKDSGEYKIFVRDTNECGPAADSTQIFVTSKTEADAGTDDTICSGKTVKIGKPGKSGVFFRWSPALFISTPNAAVAQFSPVNILKTTRFTLVRTDSISVRCVDRDTVEILVHPLPNPPLISDMIVCKDSPGSLTARKADSSHVVEWYDNPGLSNLLKTGDTLSQTQVIANRNFFAVVRDTNGCVLPNPVQASLNIYPQDPARVKSDTLCIDTVFYNLHQLINSVKPLWSGTGVINDSLFRPSSAGLFMLNYSYIDINSCTIKGETQLLINPPIKPDVGQDKNICFSDPPLILQANPIGGKWTFQGSGIAQDIFNWTQPGTYSLFYAYGKKNCARTDTLSVKINALPIVKAGADIQTCINGDAIKLNPSPTGGSWSLKNIINDTLKPKSFATGDYSAKYFFTDQNGCKDSSEFKFSVKSAPKADLKLADTACLREPAGFFNKSSGADNFLWYYGDGDSLKTFDAYHTHTYKQQGIFNIILKAINQFGCTDTATGRVLVSFPPVPLVSPSDTNGCGPLRVDLRNTSKVPGGIFSWDLGNGQSWNGFEPPSGIVYAGFPDQNIVYKGKLTVSTSYCKDRSAPINITVIATPIAKIGIQGSPIGCSPFKVKLKDNSLGKPQIKKVLINDSLVATTTDNMEYTFLAEDTTRTYKVILEVSNPGCPPSKDSIEIQAIPNKVNASFTYSTLSGNCAPQIIKFNNTSSPADVYQWNFGSGSSNYTGLDTTWLYKKGGTYDVKLFAFRTCPNSNTTISDTSVQKIIVNPQPTLLIKPEIKPCDRNRVRFINSTGLPGFSYVWDFGDGTGSAEAEPEHFFPDSGLYKVKVIGFAPITGCSDTVDLNIRIYPSPVSIIDTSRVFVCQGDSVIFENKSIQNDKSLWIWGDGLTDYDNSKFVSHTYSKPGFFSIKLITYNSFSTCYDTITVQSKVDVRSQPKAGFQLSPRVAEYKACLVNVIPSAEINPFNPCSYNLFDSKGNLLQTFTDCSPEILCNNLDPGDYKVVQEVLGDYGCRSQLENFFSIRQTSSLYLPNAFIPESGINEDTRIFKAYGTGISDFRMMIFDRWGLLLFETDKLEIGWDGKFKNSEKPVPPGIYNVKVRYSTIENEEIIRFSTVALIR